MIKFFGSRLLCLTLLACLGAADAGAADCSQFGAALKSAATLRSLAPRAKANCKAVSAERFKTLLNRRLLAQYSGRTLKEEGLIFQMLGLVPRSFNYPDCVLQLNSGGTRAFYDEQQQAVVLRTDSEVSMGTLVHEAVHALQDQHFDLTRFNRIFSLSTDQALAAAALLEGDAALIQADWDAKSAAEADEPGASAECSLPPLLDELFGYPYSSGRPYATALRRGRDYSALNTRLRAPNFLGAAQIELRLQPAEVAALIAERNRWTADLDRRHRQSSYRDSLGPVVARLALTPALGAKRARIVTAGLLFDRIFLEAVPRGRRLDWYLRLQDDQSEDEFAGALARRIRELNPEWAESLTKWVDAPHELRLSLILTETN